MQEDKIFNVYATTVEGKEIYVGDAISGRKGYYCQGCEHEMEAVKSRIDGRRSYFRHVPKDVKIERKCTYSDETYRHKLAKEYLKSIGKIKVPPLYVYPPKGEKKGAIQIRDSEFIEGYRVESELSFSEDEKGEIIWGRNLPKKEGFLLITPDITFFDHHGKPILFIEIVATHKPDQEKLAKLKRIGIDAVAVKVPKSSPEEIQQTFFITQNTKWLFNYEQSTTTYISISQRDSEGILQPDPEQRRLFEEDATCRASRIRNLIRSINRSLESESYTAIERRIRQQLSRVERNTEEARGRWDDLQEKRNDEINSALSERREAIRRRRERIREKRIGINSKESEFQENCENLEERYYRKRDKLSEEERELIGSEERRDKSKYYISKKGRPIEESIREEEKLIREIEGYIEKQRGFEERIREETEEEFEATSEGLRKSIQGQKERRGFFRTRREHLSEKYQGIEKAERQNHSRAKERIRGESIDRFEEILREAEEGKVNGYGRLSGTVKDYFDAVALLEHLAELRRKQESYRKAIRAIQSGAFKNWN